MSSNNGHRGGPPSAFGRSPNPEPFRKGRITWASNIDMEPTYWAWAENGYGRIPVGELTLVAGHGEAGKSIFLLGKIAELSTGDLPGHFFGVPRVSLVAASEDDWKKTIKPRLVVAEADLDMVGRFDVVTHIAKDGTKVSLPRDYDELEDAIADSGAAWVFFESVVSAIDLTRDINSGQHVRDVLEKLAEIARRQQCVIIGSVHFNKSTAAHAMERMSGSMEFRNVARAVIYMAMQEDGTGVISKSKNNLGRGWPSLAYEIREMVASRRPYITAGYMDILDETDADASEIIAASKKKRKMSPQLSALVDVMRKMFKDVDEWKVEDAMTYLRNAEVSTNDRTIRSAHEELGIHYENVYNDAGNRVIYGVWTTRSIRIRK